MINIPRPKRPIPLRQIYLHQEVNTKAYCP